MQAQENFLQGKNLILGIFSENSLIGICSFNVINEITKSAEIGYWVSQKYVGQGIITSAISELIGYAKASLNLQSLSISAAVHNVKSRRVAERLNFEYLGELPKHEKVADKVYDHALYRLSL